MSLESKEAARTGEENGVHLVTGPISDEGNEVSPPFFLEGPFVNDYAGASLMTTKGLALNFTQLF